MASDQALAQVVRIVLVAERLDRAAVDVAGIFADPVHHMGVGTLGHVPCHVQGGNEGAALQLLLGVEVGHLAQDQEIALDLREVTLLAEELQVGATSERCG